jgi:acyl carrier protein
MPQVAPASAASLSAVVEDMSGCVTLLRDLSVPVLSVLHGKMTGGGVALALNTDWRVCTLAAKFNHGNLPRGLNPIGGYSQLCGGAIGLARAQGMYSTDVLVGGGLALMSGLVDALAAGTDTARYCARHAACVTPMQHSCFSHSDARLLSIENVLHAVCAVQHPNLGASMYPPNAKTVALHVSHGPGQKSSRSSLVTTLVENQGESILAEIEAIIVLKVHEVVATTVGVDDELMESGVDSLAATELVNSIQHELGPAMKVPSTLIFEHPTITQISKFVASQLEERDLAAQPASLKMGNSSGRKGLTIPSNKYISNARVCHLEQPSLCPPLDRAGLQMNVVESGFVSLTMPLQGNHQHTGWVTRAACTA